VARAAPDFYTILMAPAPVMAINVALHKKLPYDPAGDFVPIALVVATPYVLVITPSLSVQSVADLVELAKAKRGQLSFTSAGHAASSVCPAVQEHDRRRDDACALPRLRARPERRCRGTCSAHVLRYPAGARLDQRGQGARARRLHQGARRRAARYFLDRRTRLGWLRRRVVADGGRAGGHARGHRSAPACRD